MSAWRVQPFTVMVVTLAGAWLGWWPALSVLGAIMLVGAVWPEYSLMDRWVSWVAREEHRTLMHPKRFAAGMGGAMLILSGILGLAGAASWAYAFAALTFAASALNGLAQLCVGCWIYNALIVPLTRRGVPGASR